MSSVASLAALSDRPWQPLPRAANEALTLVSREALKATMIVFTHTRRGDFALVQVDALRGSWQTIPETQDELQHLWVEVLERTGIHE